MTDQQFRDKQRMVKKYRSNLTINATKSEIRMKERLTQLGISFLFQKGFIKDKGFFVCDFYIPKMKLVIEVDGAAHFTNAYAAKRDHVKNQYLTKDRNFGLLRISNSETWKTTDEELKRMIGRVVRGQVSYSPKYYKPKLT